MDKEDEAQPELYVVDFSQTPGAAEWREKRDRDHQENRRRYHQLLAAELDVYGATNPAEIADVVLEALFTWRYVDSGDECMCGCHPTLPSGDLHGHGFDCNCRLSPAERAQSRRGLVARLRAFHESQEGQELAARDRAERAAVRAWVDSQRGVVVHEFGGECPEQWNGVVDGRSFYFRERHQEWRIELDLRPSGRVAQVLRGTDDEGKVVTEASGIDVGDIIATGSVEAAEYGETLVERGQFIVDTIRVHVAREACEHHSAEEIGLLEERLRRPALWCPSCGTRLPTSR
ncbi:MAG: hypothetical protein K0U84_21580 [Actinomycetia bacterium]|nr:hypothetical protein [Actinomycetes bacterium]